MIKELAVTLITFQIFSTVHTFQTSMPQPVKINEDSAITEVKKALFILGRNPKYAAPVYYSAKANDIDPILWAQVLDTESDYVMTAESSMGYKGFAQTPKAVMKTGFEVGDMTYGSCVLRDKLRISKGNMETALTYYKGSKTLTDKNGKDTLGHTQAKRVLTLYAKLKNQMKEQEES